MTHIPPITREAREFLLQFIATAEERGYYDTRDWVPSDDLRRAVNQMPLAPSSDLDAIRARFQPKTRGGLEYEIFAEKGGYLYGMVSGVAVKWRGEGESIGKVAADIYDLLPVSPHAALIAELRKAQDHCYHGGLEDATELFKRAADALEKLP